MAMLASKSPYPAPLGVLSSGHASSSNQQYPTSIATHKVPAMATMQSGTFASPTESEFSEAFEGPDSVRYAAAQAPILHFRPETSLCRNLRWRNADVVMAHQELG